METKHTPGQWLRDNLHIVAEMNGHVIARIGDAHHMLRGSEKREMQQECIANAKLIQAAPDLLALAQEVLKTPGLQSGLQVLCAAAIAKATGQDVTEVIKSI